MNAHCSDADHVISGEKLTYFLAVHEDFLRDQKNLKDFEILVNEEGQDVKVTFMPNFAPDEKLSLGGRTSLGRSVTYYVSKSTMKIVGSHFHK